MVLRPQAVEKEVEPTLFDEADIAQLNLAVRLVRTREPHGVSVAQASQLLYIDIPGLGGCRSEGRHLEVTSEGSLGGIMG